MTARLVVLASGNGTNCQALIDACSAEELDANVVAVIANNADAGVIERAAICDIPAVIVEHKAIDAERRAIEDEILAETIAQHTPDLVVLAGWMRILSARLGEQFHIINLHPAMPGELAGTNAIQRAFDEWKDGLRQASGVMVHWVPDAGVDSGPTIAVEPVEFTDTDTLETFESRIHAAEHRVIVEGVRRAVLELRTP